jgi:hypothetical protein
MENLDTNSTPESNQGVAAVQAEPKSLEEVKAADRSWFGKNPEREHRLRKAYACELADRPANSHPDKVPSTLLWVDDTGEFMGQVPWLANPDHFANGEPSERIAAAAVEWYFAPQEQKEERKRLAEEKAKRERVQAEWKAERERKEQERVAEEKAAEEKKAKDERDRIAREKREKLDRKKRGEPKFADEAYEPLPNDLQLVKFSFYIVAREDENGSVQRALERLFGSIGYVEVEYTAEDEWFYVNVEVLTTSTLAQKYLYSFDSPLRAGWTIDGKCLRPDSDVGMDDRFERRNRWTFRGLEPPHQGDYKAGDFAKWLDSVAVREEDFENLQELLGLYNGDVVGISDHMESREKKVEPQKYLVPTLLANGVITLLLGAKGHGKSTIARQLAAAVVAREPEWLGFSIDHAADNGGVNLYLSGEDADNAAEADIKRMLGVTILPTRLVVLPAAKQGELAAALKRFKSAKVALLIVDPARAYMRGDEDSSDVVNAFFNVISEFTAAKNCPTLVTHHLKRDLKGRHTRSLADVAMRFRGSQVFLDRPRVTLALLRHADEPSEFGVGRVAGIMQCNLPGVFEGTRLLNFDETTHRHNPVAEEGHDEKPAVAAVVADETREAVLAVVRRFNSKDERVTRTDKWGVYETKAPELAGQSRARVRAAVDALLADGQLEMHDSGALTAVAG